MIMRKLSLLISGIAAVCLFVAVPVGAQSRADVCRGIGVGTGAGGDDCEQPAGTTSVNSVIRAAVNILSVIVGVAGVIMIIFGGYKYITSDGDAGKVNSARQTIIYALVGLVIVALSQGVAVFVLRRS
jgi:hypothetical protein